MRTPLQPSEKILLRTHTSWVTLVLPALGILVAIGIGILANKWNVGLIAFGIAAIYFCWKFLEWKHNIWVVTNFRVIDEFGILNINTKESPLDKINNVSYNQNIWGRMLGYGNVEIQTAATIGETIYESVDGPKTLKDTITLAQANYKHVQMSEQTRSIIEQMQAAKASSLPLEPSLQKNNYPMPKQPEKIIEQEQQGPTPQPISASQIATQIEKLIALKQQGILTEEEYQRAKARLLAG
jgi:uncharacterized membrane protein YdbT with pleckstrin-like domain